MADLPEPDWIALSESVSRAMGAFDAEPSAVEVALVAAFHDWKIRTRGRCSTYFGHDYLRDLDKFLWDGADLALQVNKFTIPARSLGRKVHVFSDVAVHREDLEEWVNSDGTVKEEPQPKPKPERTKPAKKMHDRWVNQARELRKTNPNLGQSAIVRRIDKKDVGEHDPHTKGAKRDKETIRRVLTERQSEWTTTGNS